MSGVGTAVTPYLFGAADRGLAASALTAVNVEERTCHERGARQVEHSANDVGEATHPSEWMHTGIDGVRVVGVHRRVDDTGRDRVGPYSVGREFNAERLRGRRRAALGQ